MKKKMGKTLLVGALLSLLAGGTFSSSPVQAEDVIRVACVGDSLTDGYTSSKGNKGAKAYPSRLQELLGDGYAVTNCGKSSATLLNDGNRQYKVFGAAEYNNSLRSKPDIVIMMLGTNDSKEEIWNINGRTDQEAQAEFRKDVEALAAEYQAINPQVRILFATSPKVFSPREDYDIRTRIIDEQIAPLQRQIAEENGWELVDMNELTADMWTMYNPADGIHFTDNGYLYEAECMYTAITGKMDRRNQLPVLSAMAGTEQSGTDASPASHAIDNDYSTLWHSSYAAGDSALTDRSQHWLSLKLQEQSLVGGFSYLPRQANSNGIITEYEIQVSGDGVDYQTVASGTWENNAVWKYVEFAPVKASYVRLLAKGAAATTGTQLSSAAEVRVYGSASETGTLSEEKALLKAACDQAETEYTEVARYGAESWKHFQGRLAAAKEAVQAGGKTAAELREAYHELQSSVAKLEKSREDFEPLAVMEPKYFVAKDGTMLPYRIYLPENYDSGKKYPVMLYLHGEDYRGYDNVSQIAKFTWNASTQTKTNMDANGLFLRALTAENRSRYPMILVAPQCLVPNANSAGDNQGYQWVDTPWSGGNYSLDDVAVSNEMQAVDELMEDILKKYQVNENRIYAAGASMGGYAVWNLLMRHPEQYAAAVAAAGAADTSKASLVASVPVWGVHGNTDQVVPFAESTKAMCDAMQAAGAENVRYTELNGGHETARSFFSDESYDVLGWLYSYSKVDTKKLSERVEAAKAERLEGCTPKSAEAFRKALAEAEKLLADDSVAQETIDGVLAALKQAQEGLTKKADTGAITAGIAAAQQTDTTGCTPESIQAFQNALAKAAQVLADENASQAEIDAALRSLQEAKNGLQKIAQPPAPEKVKVAKVKILSVKKKGKALCIKWKKVKGASGYQIVRRTGKKGKFKKIATIKKGGTVIYKDKKAKSGKKYYYKVRAFKKVNGKTINGAYSAQKAGKR